MKDWYDIEPNEFVESLRLRFTTANEVPVERSYLPANYIEWLKNHYGGNEMVDRIVERGYILSNQLDPLCDIVRRFYDFD